MTATTHGSAAHLSDEQLMQLLDEQSVDAGAARHAGQCDHCAAELDRLRADAALFGDWLGAAAFEAGAAGAGGTAVDTPSVRIDIPTAHSHAARARGAGRSRGPARRAAPRYHGWLRAAAVLALLAGPVVAMPSTRAWIADALSDDPDPVATTTSIGGGPQEESSAIRFEPAGSSLRFTLDAAQAAGAIDVRYGAGTEVVLEITGRAGTGPVVSAAGVHIRNAPESQADYSLTVPRSVRRVSVGVGTADTRMLDAADLEAGVSIPAR